MISRVANRLTLVLLSLCIGLGAIIAWQLRGAPAATLTRPGTATQSNASDTAQARPDPLPELSPATALRAYQEVLDRPLFVKGRQPPVKPRPAAAPKQVKPMRYLLEGVAIAGDRRVALIHDPGSRERVSLEEGDIWQGWLVERVLVDKVVLSADGEQRELALEPEHAAERPPR